MRIAPSSGATVTSNPRWLSEVLAGRAFTFGRIGGPLAANFSHQQLFNPVGSGVTALVRRVRSSRNTAGAIRLNFNAAALANQVVDIQNVLNGGPLTALQHFEQDNVALLGTLLNFAAVLAGEMVDAADEWVYILPPGSGLITVPDAVATQNISSFWWVERKA